MVTRKPGQRGPGWRWWYVPPLMLIYALAYAPLPARAAGGPEMPQRVVSLHLCADQLLLALADRRQIASVSHFATDRTRSHMAEAARGIPQNRGQAEEIVTLRPDLIFAGARSARATVRALIRLGYRVVDLELVSNFDEIRAQIRHIAYLLGHRARGQALIAGMNDRLQRALHDMPENPPVAAIYQPMGFTSGRGSLEAAILGAAGFANLADRFGLKAFGHLPLERLVAAKPDIVVNWMGQDDSPSLARLGYSHPAFIRGGWKIVSVPHKYWSCGAWYSTEAVDRLAAARRALDFRAKP